MCGIGLPDSRLTLTDRHTRMRICHEAPRVNGAVASGGSDYDRAWPGGGRDAI
jgi:hypothetical protein